MKTDHKNGKSAKKIMKIINTFSAVLIIVLILTVIILRIKTDIFPPLLYGCMGAIFLGGLWGFQKFLENSSLKQEFEEANRECEKVESKKTSAGEKPDFFSLAVIAILGFIFAVSETVDIVNTMVADYSKGLSMQVHLPRFAESLTLLVCCTFIAVILFNVSKRRIFDRRNSICIYGVGVTIIFSCLLQNHLCGDIIMTDSNAGVFYSLLGFFIIFFGGLYDIAVKMKQEQDLTI